MRRTTCNTFLRIRPPRSQASMDAVTADTETGSLSLRLDGPSGTDELTFSFEGVFNPGGQDQVYEKVAREPVEALFEGYSATILAYGQTGAGKSYTMYGNPRKRNSSSKSPSTENGLVYHALAHIFQRATEEQALVKVSFLEIYNDQLHDLLRLEQHDLVLQEDPKLGVVVKGLCAETVSSIEQALEYLADGEHCRSTGKHLLNSTSSRSHAIFTIYLESVAEGEDLKLASRINFVDLAGSERLSQTESSGAVAHQAQYINRSLSSLEHVVIALGEKSREHIPYRSSKLTHFLKDSLGGTSSTSLIACVWSDRAFAHESLCTCRFAARMARLKTQAKRNVINEASTQVRHLQREIHELQEELFLHDLFSRPDAGRLSYKPYKKWQRDALASQISQLFEEYNGAQDEEATMEGISQIELCSYRHAREVLLQCNIMYNKCRMAMMLEGSRERSAPPLSSTPPQDDDDHHHRHSSPQRCKENRQSGQAEGHCSGPQLGLPERGEPLADCTNEVAPTIASPRLGSSRCEDGDSTLSEDRLIKEHIEAPKGEQQSFQEFTRTLGRPLMTAVEENRSCRKDAKLRSRELAIEVNRHKKSVDDRQRQLSECRARMKQLGESSTEHLSAIEAQCLSDLGDAKSAYRKAFEQLQFAKSEYEYRSTLVEESTKALLDAFQACAPPGSHQHQT